jgi:hypothetical protein
MSDSILDEAARRASRSWNADGIQELALGSFFLLLGTLAGLPYSFPQAASPAWRIPLLVAMMVAGLLLGRAIWAVKRAVVFPRGGYSLPRRPSNRRVMLQGATVGILAGCVSASLANGKPLVDALWLSMIAGGAIGALYVLVGCGGLRGIVALAIATIAAFAARKLFGLPPGPAGAVGLTALGLFSALAGAAALWRYIARHPVAVDGGQE